MMAAVAIEQIRQLIWQPSNVPEARTLGRLSDGDDYSDFTDLDGPLDCSDDMLGKPSLKPCPPISNVTPLRPRRSGLEGSSTRPAKDTVDHAPTVPRHDRCAASNSGMVGGFALAIDPDLEDGTNPAPAAVPSERPVMVPADPCPVAFWDACIVPARNKRLPSADLYAAYHARCREREVEPLSQAAVTRRIKAARKVHHRKSDGRKVFVGVKLKSMV